MKKIKNFPTIVSNNCWAGVVYHHFGERFTTPFINLFITSDDYMKLLTDLKKYLSYELEFITQEDNPLGQKLGDYPAAKLNDIHIHFLHYHSQEEAEEKWNERMKRIQWDNLFIDFNENENFSEEMIGEFESLKFDKKFMLVTSDYDVTRYGDVLHYPLEQIYSITYPELFFDLPKLIETGEIHKKNVKTEMLKFYAKKMKEKLKR
jgi:uncharacterized protein (DUF1919 family)